MTRERPLVSIGLPLYNAERYLRVCLDSLLGQDYPNLEVVASDNASTDATQEICLAYTRKDTRLRYVRSERNMGAIWNFNRVFELGRGDFFMWAAFDDLRDSAYVSACMELLEPAPSATLCVTDVRVIDESGQRVDGETSALHAVGNNVRARVRQMATGRVYYDIYGLARTGALKQTRLLQPVWGSDLILVFDLCLRGPVLMVSRPLFYYRRALGKSQQDMALGLGGASRGEGIPVCWTCLTLELLRSIWLAPLGFLQKPLLSGVLILRFVVLNIAVQAGVRRDLAATIKQAASGRRFGRLAVLLLLAVLVYPLHNPVTRAGYRLASRLFSTRGAARAGASR